MKECKHERVVAYTEDGARYHACRDCGEVFPQPEPTNEPPPVGQPTPQTGESTGVEGESSDRSTPNGFDPGWIKLINDALMDRELEPEIQIADLEPWMWDDFIGPMLDRIEDGFQEPDV